MWSLNRSRRDLSTPLPQRGLGARWRRVAAGMSDDGRRRGLRGSRDAGAQVRAGSGPRPNVLSDASPPNRLSTETSPNAGGQGGTQASVIPASGPQVNSRGAVVPVGERSARPGVRLPGVSTLIFLGFVALTAFRIVGEWVEDNVVPAP